MNPEITISAALHREIMRYMDVFGMSFSQLYIKALDEYFLAHDPTYESVDTFALSIGHVVWVNVEDEHEPAP